MADLFDDTTPARFGHAEVAPVTVSSILTPGNGFMRDYDFTLNPYAGCSFGCTYCYAAFFARERDLKERWGYWIRVKENALQKLQRMRRSLSGKTIYMSSVTDPYQPIERRLELVRGLLGELLKHQPRLVVQTRSPLVTRDVDLFRSFDAVQVNMTVTTDSERIRKVFEPFCPSNERRLEAIGDLAAAGVPTSVTMTPLLPLEDPQRFAERVQATGSRRFVVQPFHLERGQFVRGTRDEALDLFEEFAWDRRRYDQAVRLLRENLPRLDEGQEGFAPM